jgi:arylsulfatase A-like enzyme
LTRPERRGHPVPGRDGLRRGAAWVRVGIAALLLLASGSGCTASDEHPAIVLIVIDTLRWDRLSLSGYDRRTSPQIDRFAADAVVFERAFAPASWTRPSVASLLTGLDARKHGAVHSDEGLGPVETLAENLARGGYRTQAWITNPFLKGGGFERGFGRFEKLCLGRGFSVTGAEVTALVMAEGVVGPATFNWIHFIDPHDPYRPSDETHAELVRPYAGTARGETSFVRGTLLSGEFIPSAEDVGYLSDLYDAEIRTVDQAVGRLLDWLRSTGAYDRALVILTSDHGEEFREHGGWLHGLTVYEEQIHVPLLIKPPSSLGAAAGRRGQPVSLLDVMPTVLEIASQPLPENLDGRSLVPDLLGRSPPSSRTLFALEPLAGPTGPVGTAYTGRSDGLKWIEVDGSYPGRPVPAFGECYDLRADPGEQRNLADGGPGPCSELATRVADWRAAGIATGQHLQIDPAEAKRLRAIGYAH